MELSKSEIDDIIGLLKNECIANERIVKIATLQAVLGLTSSAEGSCFVAKNGDLLLAIYKNFSHRIEEIAKLSATVIINLSAEEAAAEVMIQPIPSGFNPVHILVEEITNKESPIADECVSILSNFAHHSRTIDKLIDLMTPQEEILKDLLKAFNCLDYNVKGCNLHNLASLFSNLTQNIRIRRYFLSKSNQFLSTLLPFTDYSDSAVRRRGVLGTLMNCCFEIAEHSWLLGPDIDILPKLLLPIAGNEEFDDEDNSKLPIELQYLESSKTRDPDANVRKTALDALYMLCATTESRKYLRDHNAYIILRELHKWEEDRNNLLVCENVVNMLIRTEDEIGVDQINDLDVPEDLKEKFINMDRDYIEDK